MSHIRIPTWRRWPLALKLVLTTTLMIVAVVAGITALSIRREERVFRTELQQQAELLLNTLVAASADPLYKLDADFLSDMMTGLGQDRIVVSGRVYDSNGRIVADAHDPALPLRVQSDPFGQRLVLSDTTVFVWQFDQLLAGRAVVVGRQRLGAVSVGLSTTPLEAKVAAVRRQGFQVALTATLLAMLLALLISRTITGPLLELTKATKRVAGGDLTHEIPVRSGDELAALAAAFNSMSARLRETIGSLEQRVAERTARLTEHERELRQAKAFLEHLIASSPGVILQGDPLTPSPTYVSPNVERVLGYTQQEILDTPNFWPQHVHPEDRPDRRATFQHAIDQKSAQAELEYRFLHKDGIYRWLHTIRRFEYDEAGNLVDSLSFPMDITERKSAEEAVKQAREEADRASLAKSEFLSRMSHELRTPLNAILGFAQLLEMDSLPPEQHGSVDQILKGGRHLLELINDVLDISRIEASGLSISLEPVAVKELIQESLDLIAPLAAEREIRLEGTAACFPDQFVMADRQRLKQVLLNLLSNAVKYNRQGGTAALLCAGAPEGRLRIKVRDTGPGIAPERMGELFTPFERLGSEKSGIEGTGLGLALSKRLVDAMKGTLGVESAVGVGSTFWVEFPVTEDPMERAKRAAAALPAPAVEASQRPRIVLCIEDNLSNIKLIQRLLAHRPQVRLIPAMQGRVGLDLAREHRPHLILLDLHLADIPGDEVLRRLREDPETSQIPVIMISADATSGQIVRLVAAGAREYLTKPLDVKKFLALLDETLGETLQEREPGHAGRHA